MAAAHPATGRPPSVHLGGGQRRPAHSRFTNRSRTGNDQARAGALLATPAVITMLVFVVAPVFMALWVSVLDWNGQSNPFSGKAPFVGADNYAKLLTEEGLLRRDFATSVRNTVYYVALSVPLVTVLSFGLAMIVNQQMLRGRGFFRTVFYFPSVTSSVAISVTFLFLFQGGGVVNAVLGLVGVEGPQWFTDSRGLVHLLLGALGVVDPAAPPGWAQHQVFSLSVWDWLSGPSVALCAIVALTVWASSGTFMLFFLAGLQNIPLEVEEAAAMDGATRWQRFRSVTLPLMRRSITLVVTLALIGSWQVFDQVYIMSQGAPGKTTLTPAYLSYQRSFGDGTFGVGAAVAFALFAIIVVLTLAQRWIGRERDR